VWAVFAAVIGLGMSISAASAATIDLEIKGKVTNADTFPGGPPSPVHANDIVTFRLTYDTSGADADPLPNSGLYTGSITRYEVSFGGQTYSFPIVDARAHVSNDYLGRDSVHFDYGANSPPYEFPLVRVFFEDYSGTMISDDSLPTDLASLQPFGKFDILMRQIGYKVPDYLFIGSITSIANFTPVAATPVPAALPLLATALGGLGFAGWRRRRHAQQSQAALEIARA
jgi:hypothetical protein